MGNASSRSNQQDKRQSLDSVEERKSEDGVFSQFTSNVEDDEDVPTPNRSISSEVRKSIESTTENVDTSTGHLNTSMDDAPMEAGPKERKKRLVITKMELENFKSYAGVGEIGIFHPCFTTVIGPNGSGKSNVIDALLFVFGKRASKLRLKKVSELVHKSAAYPNLTEARVSVFFEEIYDDPQDEEWSKASRKADQFEMVPDSAFSVTRTATKGNVSKYFIDDQPSNFTEVTQLLQGKGIDLDHNRFLILQGEVEQIAMMKAKAPDGSSEDGLLEYLEDIIGSNQYVAPIANLWQQVERLDEKRVEKANRVKAVEKEKSNLEGPRDEALQLLQKEREVMVKENVMIQLSLKESEAECTKREKNKEKAQEKFDKEQEQMQQQKEELEKLDQTYQQVKQEHDQASQELEEAQQTCAEFERQDVQLREEIRYAKEKHKTLSQSRKKEERALFNAKEKEKESEAKIPGLEEEIEKVEKKMEKQENILDKIWEEHQEETTALRAEMDAQSSALAPHQEKLNDLRAVIETKSTEVELLRQPLEDARRQCKVNKENLESTRKKLEELLSRQKEAEGEMQEMKSRQEEVENELEEARGREEDKQQTYRSKRARLEEVQSTAQTQASKSRVLRALQDASGHGGELEHAGLCGRLGDLGAIASKYDVAISTACGALDHLVVETTKGAQECVSYLRQHRLGRATFIILDKMEHLRSQMNQSQRLPAERLFDLVEVREEKFQTAFYHALRNTLVTPTLEDATKIAYQGGRCQHRVVTLKGELVEKSGAMSGGGRNVRKGGMATQLATMSESEMKELQQEVERDRHAWIEERDAKDALEKEVEDGRRRMSELERDLPRMNLDKRALETKQRDLAAKQTELEGKGELSSEDEERITALEKERQDKEQEMERVQEVVKEMESALAKLKEKILDVGGEKLRQEKLSMEKLKKQVEDKKKALTKAKVGVKSAKKAQEKAQQALDQMDSDGGSSKEKTEELKERLNKLTDEAEVAFSTKEEKEELTESLKKQMRDEEKKVSKIRKQVEELKKKEVDLSSALEDAEKSFKESQQRVTGWQGRLESLRQQFQEALESHAGLEEEEHETELPRLDEDELERNSRDELKYELTMLERELSQLRANVNMGALQAYKDKVAESEVRSKELETATNERDEKRKEYDELREKRRLEFLRGFRAITLKLKEMYQMITLGGDAELELVDATNPFAEGVVFSVRPSKKSWKNISNLSGGEKTLASLALVFALHHYKPTPLYVMDEIDAALDFKNVSIVGHYIQQRTRNAQFVIISLRNYMFELADKIVGIYKFRDATRSMLIDPDEYVTNDGTDEERSPVHRHSKARRRYSMQSVTDTPLKDRTNQ